eukprot:1486105-Amphidinium_carterae.4
MAIRSLSNSGDLNSKCRAFSHMLALVLRWISHAEVPPMLESIDLVARLTPSTFIAENVMGFGVGHENNKSALDVFSEKMIEIGYHTLTLEVDLSWWHQVTRKRSSFRFVRLWVVLQQTLASFHENVSSVRMLREISLTLLTSSTFGLVPTFGLLVSELRRLYILGFHVEKGGGASACERAQTRFRQFVQQLRSSYEPIKINSLLFADDSPKLREAMKEFEKKAIASNTMCSKKQCVVFYLSL